MEIRHHFIRDCNEKKLIQMVKIHTDKNVADLLTKAFDNGIGVNTGDSKLMLLDINLLLLGKVNAARHKLTTAVEIFLDNQLEGMAPHDEIYIAPSHTKKIFANMRRSGKGFSGRETSLFPTMMVQAQAEMGEDEAVTTASGLDAEQDRGNNSKTQSKATPNEPSSLGTSSGGGPRRQETEDASKQGRKINDIDKDAEITLVDETQGRYGDEDMFGVNDLDGDEVVVENEAVAVTNDARTIPVSVATITNVELTLAQTLAELKSTRPKAKGLVIHEEEQATTPTVSSQQPSQATIQDKGKVKMVEPEHVKKLSKKDQIRLDEELAFKLQAEEEEE
ncbi:hypothetical protein Tco_0543205 [Tanacetum coccineum]